MTLFYFKSEVFVLLPHQPHPKISVSMRKSTHQKNQIKKIEPIKLYVCIPTILLQVMKKLINIVLAF